MGLESLERLVGRWSMRGHFSADGSSYDAAWEWPGGGYKIQGSSLA